MTMRLCHVYIVLSDRVNKTSSTLYRRRAHIHTHTHVYRIIMIIIIVLIFRYNVLVNFVYGNDDDNDDKRGKWRAIGGSGLTGTEGMRA